VVRESQAVQKSRYLEHRGRSIWGVHYSPNNLFIMLTSYFDESGNPSDGFTFVCGWVSTVEQWEAFEIDWKLFLIKYGVPYLHMKEIFPKAKGPFQKWDGNKLIQAKFLSDAAEIMKERIQFGFIFNVNHSHFSTVDSLFALRGIFKTPYALAGRSIIEMSNQWRRDRISGPLEMEHVFEECEKREKNSLIAAMSSVTPFLETPAFKPSRDVKPCEEWPEGRVAVVQLQAADYLAYESRKALSDRVKKGIKPHRKSLHAILGIEVQIGRSNAMQLGRFCYSHNIRRRLPENSEIYSRFSS
jgi:hypothetical protein